MSDATAIPYNLGETPIRKYLLEPCGCGRQTQWYQSDKEKSSTVYPWVCVCGKPMIVHVAASHKLTGHRATAIIADDPYAPSEPKPRPRIADDVEAIRAAAAARGIRI